MSERKLEGRVALVSGGSRGIGRAVCLALARAGARVAINYSANEDAALSVMDALDAAENDAMTVRADVSRPDDIADAVSFLLSDKSDFMTGQTLVVDGGRVMLP